MKKALLTEIDQMIEKGLEKSSSYRMATVLRARSSSLEVKTQGNQDSVLSVLGNITREVTYTDSKGKVTKAAVPFVSLSSDSKRRSSDDVIQLDLEAQADNTSTYRLLGNGGYAPLSDGIAIRSDSYLANWIQTMFNTPLNYKAYIAHMLNAMCYRNLSDEKVKVFVCDFSQVNIKLPHADGSGIVNIGRNKFGGQDGSGLIGGPDAKTMQFRLTSLFGVGFKLAGECDDKIQAFDENAFTKGLLAKSHLSRVEGDALVFDKANPIAENIVVLDVGNFKGLVADKVIKGRAKKLLNEGKIFEMKFRSNPTGSSNKLFVEVTKVSSTATTSASYQWSAVMQLPNIDLNDMKEISPEAVSNQELSTLQKKVLNVVKEEIAEGDRISAKVLSGNANRNQVLSYLLAYLPKVTTRKCVMVNSCDDAAGYSGLAEGQIIDTRKDEKFVVGRNPMLTPAGLLVLKNNRTSWLEQIYDLSENVYTIFTAEDCKKIQGDDDGDDNGCDPNPILVDLVEEHQRWVRKSIFANGVSIENDKKARVSEEPKTLKQIADLLKIVKGNSNKVLAKAYCDNSIAGVEQAAVGLCSDIAVNIFAQIKWTKWNGKTGPHDAMIARSKILFQKDLFGELLNQQPDNEKWIWIPNGLESLKMLMLYFLVVWMTQTSIDWKKRSYIILCVLYFLDECRYDQGVFKINKSIMQMKGFDYKAFTAIKKADEKIGQINNHFYPRAEGEKCRKANDSFYAIYEILGGWIAAQKAMIISDIDKLIPGIERIKQPADELFWDIGNLGAILWTAININRANANRDWKSYAKNCFYKAGDGYIHWDTIKDEYAVLRDNTWECNALHKLLSKTIDSGVLKKIHRDYSSFKKVSLAGQKFIEKQNDDMKEWKEHLVNALKEAKSLTNVDNAWETSVSVKGFQNFLRVNKLEFNPLLIKLLMDVDSDDNSMLSGRDPLITTIVEYAGTLENSVHAFSMEVEDAIMNSLDDMAYAVMGSLIARKNKLMTKVVRKAENVSYSAWFKAGWKNEAFKEFNNLWDGDILQFVGEFREEFNVKLKNLSNDGKLQELLNKALNDYHSSEESTSKHGKELLEVYNQIVVANIARTLRTLQYWSVAKDWKELKTNAFNFYKNCNRNNQGNFKRFNSSTSPWQLIEKLILEKGWIPSDISLHLALFRPMLEHVWIHDGKKMGYLYAGDLSAFSFTGDSKSYPLYDLVHGVCGTFTPSQS